MPRWPNGARRFETVDDLLNNATPIPDTGCWIWLGSVAGGTGYPVATAHNGKPIGAHRLMATLAHGAPLPRMDACHKCDVRTCINPDHLFRGTRQENLLDMRRKGRAYNARGEAHPKSKLTGEQVAEIRKRHREGEQQKALAREFGVRPQSVAAIVHGRHWKHTMEKV